MNSTLGQMDRNWRMVVCAVAVLMVVSSVDADDWPQWRGPNRDGVWRETGIVSRLDAPDGRLPLRWQKDIGAGYSGPTVADGRVYVSDRISNDKELERVHCFDFKTGKSIWKHAYEAEYGRISYKSGPRTSVLIDPAEPGEKVSSRAYSLGGVGHLHCYDAATGKVLWKRNLTSDYKIRMPRWGIAASPIVVGHLLILQIGGSDGACIIGLDKRTGAERWRALEDDASYVAPIMVQQASKRVLVCYTSDNLVGMDPKTGKVYWSYAMPGSKWPISVSTPVVYKAGQDQVIFTTNAHVGSALVKLESDKLAVTEIWRRNGQNHPDNMHSLIPTPVILRGHIYGTHSRGELRCLELMTGKRVWESTEPVKLDRFATIHMVAQGDTGDRVWIFNEHGELIIAELTASKYQEISRAKLIAPTQPGLPSRRAGVTWSHPAFAYRHVFARNDRQLVCADLSAK